MMNAGLAAGLLDNHFGVSYTPASCIASPCK